jgi:hypothetical protein
MATGYRTKKVDLLYINQHPDLRTWNVILDENYLPGLFLNGCWPTQNERFIAICILYEDYIREKMPFVAQLNNMVAAVVSGNQVNRQTHYFGYLRQEHYWMYIGKNSKNEKLESWEKAVNMRNSAHVIYGGRFWSTKWVEENYGLRPKELPADWQQYTDPKYKEAIESIVTAYFKEHYSDGD